MPPLVFLLTPLRTSQPLNKVFYGLIFCPKYGTVWCIWTEGFLVREMAPQGSLVLPLISNLNYLYLSDATSTNFVYNEIKWISRFDTTLFPDERKHCKCEAMILSVQLFQHIYWISSLLYQYKWCILQCRKTSWGCNTRKHTEHLWNCAE